MTTYFIAMIVTLFSFAMIVIFVRIRAFRLAHNEINSLRQEFESKQKNHVIESFLNKDNSNLSTKLIRDLESAQDLKIFLSFQAGQFNSMLRFPRMISSILVLLGLLGTITGILMSMEGIDVASNSTLNVNEVSKGIELIFNGLDTAFITTFFGIAGTLILIGFNYYASIKADKLWAIYLPFAHNIFKFFQSTEIKSPDNKNFEKMTQATQAFVRDLDRMQNMYKESSFRMRDVSQIMEKNIMQLDKSFNMTDISFKRLSKTIKGTNDNINKYVGDFVANLDTFHEKSKNISNSLIGIEDELANLINELKKLVHNLIQTKVSATTQMTRKTFVRLQMNQEIETFDEERKNALLDSIARQLNSHREEIDLIYIIPGSVIVTLEMNEEDAIKFIKLYLNQNQIIRDLKIERVELKPLFSLPSESYPQNTLYPVQNGKPRIKILFLTANPSNTARLRIDEEIKKIKTNLQLAKERENLELEQEWAVTVDSLMQAILDKSPNIIHFSGHGKQEGIILQNETGESIVVSTAALTKLFELFKDKVRCVIINSCYSEMQAEAIKAHIPYVIGVKSAISDNAAIAFSIGFYKAIGAGKDVPFAFQFGVTAIQLEGVHSDSLPVLL